MKSVPGTRAVSTHLTSSAAALHICIPRSLPLSHLQPDRYPGLRNKNGEASGQTTKAKVDMAQLHSEERTHNRGLRLMEAHGAVDSSPIGRQNASIRFPVTHLKK